MFSHERLRKAREARGYTRTDLHLELVLIGVRRCRALIDLWEGGRSEPRASDLEALARVLEVPISSFFSPEVVGSGSATRVEVLHG